MKTASAPRALSARLTALMIALSMRAERVGAMVEYVAGQASVWFDSGLALLAHLDHRSRSCTAAMAGVYRRLLRRMRAQPTLPLTERVSLPAWEKGLVAVRSISGLQP